MAAPMQTFLFNYGSQMAGKNICLIVSSASSSINDVVADAKRLVPNGKFVEPNLWIRSSQTSNCHSLIAEWLKNIDYSGLISGISAAKDSEDVKIGCTLGGLSVSGNFKSLSLFDMSGAKMLETSNSTINTTSLVPGIYVARIDNGKGMSSHKKLFIGR